MPNSTTPSNTQTPKHPNTPSITCFGEVLWDLLPTGKIAGGAPMNVAYHANHLGLPARMISCVGADDLGRELLAFLREKGLSTDLIQIDPTFPTGIVKVTLDAGGGPSYEIVQPVAWDFIQPEPAALEAVRASDALVFGSLACRTERTKATLLELLSMARWRVFDVNLRTPYFSKELLEELLPLADVVKMNHEELDTIAGWWGAEGGEAEKMAFLKDRFNLAVTIVTKGGDGAVLLDDNGSYRQPGFPVQVQDTIGSGDAFLAGYLKKSLDGAPAGDCLQFACALGALVATKKGGTPEVREDELDAIRVN
jgi:fructokinase